MIPPRPTIQPSFSLTNWTLSSVALTGTVTLDQTAPPLLVFKTTSPRLAEPTTQPRFFPLKRRLYSSGVAPSNSEGENLYDSLQVWPPSSVAKILPPARTNPEFLPTK